MNEESMRHANDPAKREAIARAKCRKTGVFPTATKPNSSKPCTAARGPSSRSTPAVAPCGCRSCPNQELSRNRPSFLGAPQELSRHDQLVADRLADGTVRLLRMRAAAATADTASVAANETRGGIHRSPNVAEETI